MTVVGIDMLIQRQMGSVMLQSEMPTFFNPKRRQP